MSTQQLAALILLLPVAGYGLYLLSKALQARDWPHVSGTILTFEEKLVVESNHLMPEARVAYTYVVNGRNYESNSITFCDWLLTRGLWQVRRLRKRFAVGSTVSVYYNPVRPENSILRRPGLALPLAILLISALGAVVFLNTLGTRFASGRQIPS